MLVKWPTMKRANNYLCTLYCSTHICFSWYLCGTKQGTPIIVCAFSLPSFGWLTSENKVLEKTILKSFWFVYTPEKGLSCSISAVVVVVKVVTAATVVVATDFTSTHCFNYLLVVYFFANLLHFDAIFAQCARNEETSSSRGGGICKEVHLWRHPMIFAE